MDPGDESHTKIQKSELDAACNPAPMEDLLVGRTVLSSEL